MEYFIKPKFIRLQSCRNKYLAAGKDGESVKQSSQYQTRGARWAVELVPDKPNLLRLRSCYDKFLTASDEPFLLGLTGLKVLQTVQSDSSPSVLWEPVREKFCIKLRSVLNGMFLRANGGTPPWKNSVTVDVPERGKHYRVLWTVDVTDNGGDYHPWPRKIKALPSTVGCENGAIDKHSSLRSNIDFVWDSSSSSLSIEAEDVEVVDLSPDEDDDETGDLPARSYSLPDQRKGAMELFHNAKTVRLRSHHDKYLLADDDKESVCQDRHHGGTQRARWTIEYVKSVEGVSLVRLKSCYDKYLTATDDDFFMGVTGKKVKQTMPRRLDSSIEWEPIRDGMQLKLKTRYGNFLRANGGVPPWRNSITHDVPSRSHTQDWILWEIDVLEVYEKVEEEKKEFGRCESEVEPFEFKPQGRSKSSEFASGVNNEGRLIHFNVVDDDGNIVEGDHSIDFKGNGVEELTQMLEEVTRLADITICSRNPLNGKLYPMRLDLPPNHVKLHVHVVPSSSTAAVDFAH